MRARQLTVSVGFLVELLKGHDRRVQVVRGQLPADARCVRAMTLPGDTVGLWIASGEWTPDDPDDIPHPRIDWVGAPTP